MRGGQRALEDAQYAVQLAETLPSFGEAFRYLGSSALDEATVDPEVRSRNDHNNNDLSSRLHRHHSATPQRATTTQVTNARAAAWERLAEAQEQMRDIDGAIIAYERSAILNRARSR